jgi:hypothetical protein
MAGPRAPAGAGVARALETLGGGISGAFVSGPGSSFNRRRLSRAALDRAADIYLQQGRHALAEHLAHQAAALRLAVAP